MKKELNKVIIIGTDHHNVLGTVRCFGVNHIKPYGVIVKTDDSPLFVTKSKYWADTWVIDDDDKIYDTLIKHFPDEKRKPVIIGCSDGSMGFIDSHLELLEERFIVPSLNHQQGAINALMNKENQTRFLHENGISAFSSQTVNLHDGINTDELDFPVILKPVVSFEGDKKDIAICSDKSEYQRTITEFISKGYRRVLVQHYYKDLTEYLITGMITEKDLSFTVCKNIRQWPLKTGSGCYSCFVNDEACLVFVRDVLTKLQNLGYQGPIDIEFFRTHNSFYLNEINWRVSGRNYVDLHNKKYSSYLYYFNRIGEQYPALKNRKATGFVINESSDIRSAVLSKEVSLLKWLVQLFFAKSYALWFWKDLKPAFARYKYYLKKYTSKSE